MQTYSVANKWSECMTGVAGSFPSPGLGRPDETRRAHRSPRVARIALLLLGVLAGCAVRAPHPDGTQTQAGVPEPTVKRLISVWGQHLHRYINQEGGGDPAVLSQTRVLHSRDAPRPARITFDVLDVDAQVPSRDGWDVEGVLVGKQATGTQNWYFFLVGIVARSGYRPSSIEDIRLVGVSAQGGHLSWVISPPDRKAVRRYWETFRAAAAIRFPGETDRFIIKVDEDRAWVQEIRSGAEWTLRPGADSSVGSGT